MNFILATDVGRRTTSVQAIRQTFCKST